MAVFNAEKMGKSTLHHGAHLFAGLNCFASGQEHAPHTHAGQDKLYFVVEGHGVVQIGGETQPVAAGDAAFAPAGVEHSLRNPGPGRLIVMAVLSPPPPRP